MSNKMKLDDGTEVVLKERTRASRLINIQLHLIEDGKCNVAYCKEADLIMAKVKKMSESDEEFDIDSMNALEKAFMCIINSLHGFAEIGTFEDSE